MITDRIKLHSVLLPLLIMRYLKMYEKSAVFSFGKRPQPVITRVMRGINSSLSWKFISAKVQVHCRSFVWLKYRQEIPFQKRRWYIYLYSFLGFVAEIIIKHRFSAKNWFTIPFDRSDQILILYVNVIYQLVNWSTVVWNHGITWWSPAFHL